MDFTYSEPQVRTDILSLDRESIGNLPEGLDQSRFRWVDLDGDGLSGVLTDTDGSWYYKRNLTANNLVEQFDGSVATRTRFGPLEAVAALPSHSDLSRGQQFLDLSVDGRLDLVAFADSDPGYFERAKDASFEPFHRFASLPQLNCSDPNLKFIDLTDDGLADILITEDGLFTFHPSLGEAGFDVAE